MKYEYLNLVTLQTGQERRSPRAFGIRGPDRATEALFEQAITSGVPGDVLGFGWWLEAFESADVTDELRNMNHMVLRVGIRLEFRLWPRVYDTQPHCLHSETSW